MSSYYIDIAQDLETEITKIASQEGISIEQFLDDALRQSVKAKRLNDITHARPRKGREVLDKWRKRGFVRSETADEDSVDFVNRMRALAEAEKVCIMPLALLDTDVVVDIQRDFNPATDWFDNADLDALAIPGYVVLELIQHARNRKEAENAKSIINDLQVLWPDAAKYSWTLDSFASLHLTHGIGLIDMMIAATVLTHDAVLYTFNVKHYQHVPGLKIVQPYAK